MATQRKRKRPVFGVVYGPHGVGKSTFATAMPNPIFLPTERGLDQITVSKMPQREHYGDFLADVDAIENEPNQIKSVVIDTADGLEELINEEVCRRNGVRSIGEIGYGKGQIYVRDEWVKLLKKLVKMSEKRHVMILCHSRLKTSPDPTVATPYDTHELRLARQSSEVIMQAVDLVLFAHFITTVTKQTQSAQKGRGIVTGDRELITQPSTGVTAKNRYNLSNPLPLSWKALGDEILAFYAK